MATHIWGCTEILRVVCFLNGSVVRQTSSISNVKCDHEIEVGATPSYEEQRKCQDRPQAGAAPRGRSHRGGLLVDTDGFLDVSLVLKVKDNATVKNEQNPEKCIELLCRKKITTSGMLLSWSGWIWFGFYCYVTASLKYTSHCPEVHPFKTLNDF